MLPSQQVVCSARVKFACVKYEDKQKDHKFSGNKKVEECYLCLYAEVCKSQITTIVNVLRPRTCSPSSISKRQSKSALLELLVYASFYIILSSHCHVSKAKHSALLGPRASRPRCAHPASIRLIKTLINSCEFARGAKS